MSESRRSESTKSAPKLTDSKKSDTRKCETPRKRKQSAIQRIRERVSEEELLAFERRCLAVATITIVLALVLWIVAMSTDYWFLVSSESGEPLFVNASNVFFVNSYSGLWKICRFLYLNGSLEGPLIERCHYHKMFPSAEFIRQNPEIDPTILNFSRTETSFSIISLLLIVMSFGFSLYTFKQTRYTYKRLAGGVHFIAAAAVLVVIEVVVNSVDYEETYLKARHPPGAVWKYGFSFALAWVTFVIMVICGCTFLIFSRKKKSVDGMDDQPNVMGRM